MKHQNKVFRTIMALAATAILAASCAKEMMTKDEFFEGLYEKCTIEADATLPGSGDADSTANTDKAYLDGSGKVMWQIGDRLNINGTSLTVATIDSGDLRAKFYGTVNGIVDGSYRRFWAAYPTNFAASFTNPNSLSFTLPATQTINPSNHSLQGYTYMVGYTRVPQGFHRLHFQMRNMGSVLKLTLKANANDSRKTVDKIEFTSDANLTGTFNVDNNSNSPTITQGSSGSTKLVVNFTGGGLDISSQTTIYVFLPPLLNKSLTMRIYGGYGLVPYIEKTVSSISLARNVIRTYTNTNINFDYVFTVASNRKVIFSPGTLQWSPTNGGSSATTHTTADGTAAGTWRFAPNQYDMIGQNNTNITNITYNSSGSYTGSYKGWIDLIGWGTSGYSGSTPWKYSLTETGYGKNANINGTKYDWGTYNAIYNPKTGKTDQPGTWRTLTKAEWTYLLNPDNASTGRAGNRFAKATVNSVKGLIILPDGWSTSTYSLSNYNSKTASFGGNNINATNWKTLENNGCVFLPACGYRYKRDATPNATTYVTRVVTGSDVYCWSGTYISDNVHAWHLWVDASQLSIAQGGSTGGRRNGYAVRLVRTHN